MLNSIISKKEMPIRLKKILKININQCLFEPQHLDKHRVSSLYQDLAILALIPQPILQDFVSLARMPQSICRISQAQQECRNLFAGFRKPSLNAAIYLCEGVGSSKEILVTLVIFFGSVVPVSSTSTFTGQDW